jgi:hypothetical protein
LALALLIAASIVLAATAGVVVRGRGFTPPEPAPASGPFHLFYPLDSTNFFYSNTPVTPDTGTWRTNHGEYFEGDAREPTFVNVSGTNNCFQWDGNDDVIEGRLYWNTEREALHALSNSTRGTISAWVRVSADNNDQQPIVSLLNTNFNSVWRCNLDVNFQGPDALRFSMRTNAAWVFRYQTANNFFDPYVGQWIHIAVAQPGDGGGWRLYVDAVEQSWNVTDGTTTNRGFDVLYEGAGGNTLEIFSMGKANAANDALLGRLDNPSISTNWTAEWVTNLYLNYPGTNDYK